mmetsp:Transcript_15811/g.42958  ORF Transcript_15811/g.42958 Transcript_15811/m.42958 type:complete len:255 (-) Transcript_15811:1332-2096(-)
MGGQGVPAVKSLTWSGKSGHGGEHLAAVPVCCTLGVLGGLVHHHKRNLNNLGGRHVSPALYAFSLAGWHAARGGWRLRCSLRVITLGPNDGCHCSSHDVAPLLCTLLSQRCGSCCCSRLVLVVLLVRQVQQVHHIPHLLWDCGRLLRATHLHPAGQLDLAAGRLALAQQHGPGRLQHQVWHTKGCVHVVGQVHIKARSAARRNVHQPNVVQQPLHHAADLLPGHLVPVRVVLVQIASEQHLQLPHAALDGPAQL